MVTVIFITKIRPRGPHSLLRAAPPLLTPPALASPRGRRKTICLDSKAIRGDEDGNYAVLVTRSCGVTTGVALRALGCPARVCTSGGAHQNRSRGLSLPRYVSHLLSAPKRRSVSLTIICLQTLLSLAPGDQDQIILPRPTAVVNHIGRLAPSVPPPVIAVRGWTP